MESIVAPFLKDRQKLAEEAVEEYKLAKDEFKAVIKKYNEIDKTKLSPRKNSDNLIELSWAYHELGYIYFIEKSYLSAEENFKRSIRTLNLIPEQETRRLKDDNEFPISWFLNDLGYLYFEWEKYDEAIEQYNSVIEEDPENGYSQFYCGLAYYQVGDLDLAARFLKSALQIFDRKIGRVKDQIQALGHLNESLKLFIEAKNRIDALKTLKGSLDAFEKHFEKGQIKKIVDFDKNKAIIMNCDKGDITIFNDTKKCKAIIELSKNLRDNLTEFQKNASLSSILEQFKLAKASILTNIGRIETDRENYLPAEDRFNEAREIYDELKSYFDAGITTVSQYKEWRNISALHNNIGILLYKTDRIDKAREQFNIALRYLESARVYNNLGNTYFKKGDKVKATECYLNALEIKPRLKEAKENLRMLKEDKEKAANWWDWWFNSQSRGKFITGLILIFMFLSVIITVFIPLNAIIPSYAKIDWSLNNSEERTVVITTPIIEVNPAISSGFNKSSKLIVDTKTNKVTNETKVTTTEETTGTNPTKTETTKTTSKQIDVSPETKLLFAALILFALIHPQIKGFSAGSIKFDLEPIVASKGAASLQCAL